MRNLLKEAFEVSTTSHYLNEDGTKSDTKVYDFVNVKIDLGNNKSRYYTIHASGYVGRKDLAHTPFHTIMGCTYDNDSSCYSDGYSKRYITYEDDYSFSKAIMAIEKKLRG